MSIRIVSCALALLGLASVAAAQVVHVPGDFVDPQTAIAQSPAGATIVIHGGQWLPIVIDKPLTLVGVPGSGLLQPLILPDGPPPVAQSPVALAGTGPVAAAGAVKLVNLHLGGGVDATIYSGCAASISGGGFASLQVFDSLVEGAPWLFGYSHVFPGADAIDVSVPFTWIERSEVRGADAFNDDTATVTNSEDAGTAIRTPGTVVVLDSKVAGVIGE